MAIETKTKEYYQTNDGQTHDTLQEAERHELSRKLSLITDKLATKLRNMHGIVSLSELEELEDKAADENSWEKHDEAYDKRNEFFKSVSKSFDWIDSMWEIANNFISMYQELGIEKLETIFRFIDREAKS